MYQEWMDGVPLLVSGCRENNLLELTIARDYYERNGDKELAEQMQQTIENYY